MESIPRYPAGRGDGDGIRSVVPTILQHRRNRRIPTLAFARAASVLNTTDRIAAYRRLIRPLQPLPLFNFLMIAELGRIQRVYNWTDERHDKIKAFLDETSNFLRNSKAPSFVSFVDDLNKMWPTSTAGKQKWWNWNPEIKVRPQYCVKYGDDTVNGSVLYTFDQEAVLWYIIQLGYIKNSVDNDVVSKITVTVGSEFNVAIFFKLILKMIVILPNNRFEWVFLGLVFAFVLYIKSWL